MTSGKTAGGIFMEMMPWNGDVHARCPQIVKLAVIKEMTTYGKNKTSPWAWIPTLYFAEGIPYFIVNVISVIMFKRMGMSNGDIAMYTGLLYLPWTVKPLWSPFVDIIKTKRWWILSMQIIIAAAFALAAMSLPHPSALETGSGSTPVSLFSVTLVIFWVTAFASATHDIAADGYYMLALDQEKQSFFVGIRSTFYRLASIFGQGVLVVMAGLLETHYGTVPKAWTLTLLICAVLFGTVALYHMFVLPRAEVGSVSSSALSGKEVKPASEIIREFGRTFATFFSKRHVWIAILFMLLYRLPEAFLVKMMNPFLLDPREAGGLGLSTENVGIVYGTVGVAALTLGGIVGGICASRWGLKKSLWPMAASMTLPCLTFVYLAIAQPDSFLVINICVLVEQFGYGFGFTAYMLYLIYFSQGEFKTAHYSLCTAFMALSMMLPGMVAGYLQEWLGYSGFFWMVIACCIATVIVTFLIKVDPAFGKKS